jgi:hypothetical protein
MLASAKLVGFVPTTDYEQARAFCVAKLGFEFVSLDQFALVVSVGGHRLRITKIPNFKPLQGTILGWEVDHIEAAAAWLKDRGVPLEKYPFAQDQELGIWTAPVSSDFAVSWRKYRPFHRGSWPFTQGDVLLGRPSQRNKFHLSKLQAIDRRRQT